MALSLSLIWFLQIPLAEPCKALEGSYFEIGCLTVAASVNSEVSADEVTEVIADPALKETFGLVQAVEAVVDVALLSKERDMSCCRQNGFVTSAFNEG